MKLQHSCLDFCYLTRFFQHCKSIYGANLRANVFRVISGVLDREFESIETSSGFAQFLGENWDFQMMSEKKFVKLQKSRSEHCDFTKKIVASIFDKKNDSKQKVNEISQN